ncbi:S9 family peptidase [Natrinema altunense]|uniref:S9 family peptidase n=1 Tax=Natrinema altunense TaxID=222984 RepID=A0A482XWZ5_9EURY|nr:S9 family peptidase [Natrinema altunense]RZH66474.1 S9 family peptidase [Natrinema altunense]
MDNKNLTHSLEQYLQIRSAYGPTINPSGDQLAFLMDVTGVPQLWTLNGPDKWPKQRTFFSERVAIASWSPAGDEICFGMDKGGNECVQFYLLDLSTGKIDQVTDAPESKHFWGGWNKDGSAFVFTSNRRNGADFDIYIRNRTDRETTCVLEGDGWLEATGFSPNDDRVIVTKARSTFDHDLFVLNLETRDMDHVTPGLDESRYQSASWGPSGQYIYVITDKKADRLYLARIDVNTGDMETIVQKDQWNIEGIVVNQLTGHLIYAVNVGGYTRLVPVRVDESGICEEFPTPKVPAGVAGGIEFSKNGDRYAVTVNSPVENANVLVVETDTGVSQRWTRASTAGIPQESFIKSELIRYKSFDGLEIPAFLSVSDHTKQEVPVIVDIHGGPESQRRPSFNPFTQYFLDKGYAIFEPNIRGSTGYGQEYHHLDDKRKRMDAVKDVKAGVEWLQEHHRVESDQIVAMGASYGGFMVLSALTEYPDMWAAGIDIVGIANFVTFLENTGEWRRELREREYGSLDEHRKFLEEISPINNIDCIQAPLFVVHGENDPRVPVTEAKQIAEEASDYVPVELIIFSDEGHGITKQENKTKAYTQIADFLDEHIR